ncbi:MAG TPA: hypothetical protein VGL77_10320 [Armatimonadota bacterium]|jgi:hypothetical protein
MSFRFRVLILAVLVLGCHAWASAKLPLFTECIDGINAYFLPPHRCEVGGGPITVYYRFRRISGGKSYQEIPPGTVTITCTGGAKHITTTLKVVSLQEQHYSPEQAFSFCLPKQPGIYDYVVTVRVPDPDDPKHVWTLSSPPQKVTVFSVLKRTTMSIGPEGGTITSTAYPDCPQITFHQGDLLGTAKCTLEVLSDRPFPPKNIAIILIGKTVYLHMVGARLREGRTLEIALPFPKRPKYPHRVHGLFMCPGFYSWEFPPQWQCCYDTHMRYVTSIPTMTDEGRRQEGIVDDPTQQDFAFYVGFELWGEDR